MAELNNKINILVSADYSQAERTLRTAPNAIAQHGRAAGDAWGRGFNTAADRWMRAIGGVLRRFGGEFGRQVAEGLEVTERFSKAREATERLERTGIRSAEGGIARTATGTAIGQEASALRQGLASGVGGVAGGVGAVTVKNQSLISMGRVTRLLHKYAQLQEAEVGNKLTQFLRSKILDIGGTFTTFFDYNLRTPQQIAAAHLKNLEDIPSGLYAKGSQFAKETKRELFLSKMARGAVSGTVNGLGALTNPFLSVFSSGLGAAGAIGAGLAIPVLFFTQMAKARDEMKKLAKEAGLTVGVFSRLKDDKDFLDIWKKWGEEGIEAAKKIQKIKDPLARNREALSKFGEDGINTYHNLLEASDKYNKAQKEVNYTVEGLKDTWQITGNAILGWFKAIGSFISKGILKFIPGGIGADLAKDLQEGEAGIIRLTKRLEESRRKQALQKDIDKELLDITEKRITLEQSLNVKKEIANKLAKEALHDKEKELEFWKLQKEIQEDQDKLNKDRQEEMRTRLDLQAALDEELSKYVDEQLTTQEQLNKKIQEYNEYTKKDLQTLTAKIKYLQIINDILKLQKQLANEPPVTPAVNSPTPPGMFGFPLQGKGKVDESKLTLSQLALLHPEYRQFYIDLNKAEMAQKNYAPGTQGYDYYKSVIQDTLRRMRDFEAGKKIVELDPMIKAFIENGNRLPILPVMGK